MPLPIETTNTLNNNETLKQFNTSSKKVESEILFPVGDLAESLDLESDEDPKIDCRSNGIKVLKFKQKINIKIYF